MLAEPRHPLGSVAGGQVALLRHRYHQEALTAGALVGEDRSLAAAWLADDPDASVQVATLEGSRQSYLGTDVEVSVRPVHALRGRCAPDGLEVFPSPRMAVALEAHRAPGGFAGWTGNEGTVSAHRYRGAALVRIPGPRGLLAPEVSAQLAMVDALADARADRLEEVLPALQATLAALRSGSWAQRLREQVATLPPPAASAAIQEAVEAWWKPLARLDDHELHLLHAPILEPGASRDALLAVGAEAVAAEAVAAGWSRWHESVWGPAPDALVSGLTYWAVDRSEASRLASAPQVRHLVLSTWPDDLEHLPELPSVEVLELLDPSAVSVPLDLQTTPRLRRLCWKGEVSGAVGLAGQLGLFGGPEAAGGPVHVALEAPGGELPEGVCTARLRSLALSPSLANQVVHGLHRLRGTPRLRRLALRGLASVEELPFDALPRLTHLTLHRASSVRGPLLLPSFVQSMLERLEHLSLRGFDLSAVDLSRCGRLLSLELDHCIGVGAAPPGGDLRSLSLSHTALPFPRSLLRLESLRVVGGGQALAIAACPPRLRELHLAELGEVCLRGLAGAPLRALHLERLAQLSHPAGWALPGLESLTLRHLPVSRCPVECPDLRFLEVVGLPLEGLGEEGLYELVDLTLCDLPGLGALPSWLVDCHRLQRLHLEDTGVPHLPSLEAFAELHEVWFLGEDRVVDDALAETLLAAPVLTTVTLVPPAPDRGDRSVRAQLSAAGRPPEEGDGSWGGGTGEDDIPF